VFDKDRDGCINATELRNALTSLGERLTDEEVSEIFKEADLNGDGMLNVSLFLLLYNAYLSF
jgi:Ca2+-binding EF-hand superfamily protein